jgi:hypothetical protein
VALKKALHRWQRELAQTGWNSLCWNNHDQRRVVSRSGRADRRCGHGGRGGSTGCGGGTGPVVAGLVQGPLVQKFASGGVIGDHPGGCTLSDPPGQRDMPSADHPDPHPRDNSDQMRYARQPLPILRRRRSTLSGLTKARGDRASGICARRRSSTFRLPSHQRSGSCRRTARKSGFAVKRSAEQMMSEPRGEGQLRLCRLCITAVGGEGCGRHA